MLIRPEEERENALDTALAVTDALQDARDEGKAEGIAEGITLSQLDRIESRLTETSAQVTNQGSDIAWLREQTNSLLIWRADQTAVETIAEAEADSSLTESLTEAETEANPPESEAVLEVITTKPERKRKKGNLFGGLVVKGNRSR